MQLTQEQLREKMQQLAQQQYDQQTEQLNFERWCRQRTHTSNGQYAAQNALHVTQQIPQLGCVVSDTMGLQKEHMQLGQLHQQLDHPTQEAQLLTTTLEGDCEEQEEYDQQMQLTQDQLEEKMQQEQQLRLLEEKMQQMRNFDEECHGILKWLQHTMHAQQGQEECYSFNDRNVDRMTHVGKDAGIGEDGKAGPKDRVQNECHRLKDVSVATMVAGG